MSNPNLNRAFLKNLATQAKTEEVNRIISLFTPAMTNAARAGQTSYLFDMSNMKQVPNGQVIPAIQSRLSYSIDLPELVTLIHAQFKDCKVTLQENTIQINPHTTAIKRGILIDWS